MRDANGDGWMDRHVPSEDRDGGEPAGQGGGDRGWNQSNTEGAPSFGGVFGPDQSSETNPYASS
jgi:hypothetical protein